MSEKTKAFSIFFLVITIILISSVLSGCGNAGDEDVAVAPTPTGDIVGKVVDFNGVGIAGVKVDYDTKISGKTIDSTLTDDDGNFSFSGVNIGNYSASTTETGFAPGFAEITVMQDQQTNCMISLLSYKWQRSIGGTDEDNSGAVVLQTNDGGYVITGRTFSTEGM